MHWWTTALCIHVNKMLALVQIVSTCAHIHHFGLCIVLGLAENCFKLRAVEEYSKLHHFFRCFYFQGLSIIRTRLVYSGHGCEPLPHQFFIRKVEIINSHISLLPWRDHCDTRGCSHPPWHADRRRCGHWSHYSSRHILHLPWTSRCHSTTNGDKRELK